MNDTYFQLTKKIFPNTNLIIDRLNIVKHLHTTFDESQV